MPLTSAAGLSYTNNFKNILNKLRDVLRTEFKGSLPVYVGHGNRELGSQYLQLNPIGSDLVEKMIHGELREYTIEMYYYFSEPNVNKSALDQVLLMVSRIEALISNNHTMTLTDSSNLNGCVIEATELNASENENEYVVLFTWKAQHLANIS